MATRKENNFNFQEAWKEEEQTHKHKYNAKIGALLIGRTQNPFPIWNAIFQLRKKGHSVSRLIIDKTQGGNKKQFQAESLKWGFDIKIEFLECAGNPHLVKWSKDGEEDLFLTHTFEADAICDFIMAMTENKTLYYKAGCFLDSKGTVQGYCTLWKDKSIDWASAFQNRMLNSRLVIERLGESPGWELSCKVRGAKDGHFPAKIAFSSKGDGIIVDDGDNVMPLHYLEAYLAKDNKLG